MKHDEVAAVQPRSDFARLQQFVQRLSVSPLRPLDQAAVINEWTIESRFSGVSQLKKM